MLETARRYAEPIFWGISSAALGGLAVFAYLIGDKSYDLPFFAMFSAITGGIAVGSARHTYDKIMLSYFIESFSGVSEEEVLQDNVFPNTFRSEFEAIAHPSPSYGYEELVFE